MHKSQKKLCDNVTKREKNVKSGPVHKNQKNFNNLISERSIMW